MSANLREAFKTDVSANREQSMNHHKDRPCQYRLKHTPRLLAGEFERRSIAIQRMMISNRLKTQMGNHQLV